MMALINFLLILGSVMFGAWSEQQYHWFARIEGHFFVHVLRMKKLKK